MQILTWCAGLYMSKGILSSGSDEAVVIVIFLFLFCVVFSSLVRYAFYRCSKFKYFDLKQGLFYPNKKRDKNNAISLADINKLYLIAKSVISSGKYYFCYELVLYTGNGHCEVVMNHADGGAMSQEAAVLAQLLKIPLERLQEGQTYSD